MKKIISFLTAVIVICASLTVSLISTDAEAGNVILPGLYNEGYYTKYGTSGYGAVFDSQNQTITTKAPQFKAMLNYASDMTTFKSSVSITGNESSGLIYAGVGFHIQESDFQNATFNTAGYSVLLARGTSNIPATSVQLLVRYCSENNTYKNVASIINKNAVSGTDKDLKLRLELEVKNTDFNIKVYDTTDNTQVGETLTLPLDNTEKYPTTSYYSAGSYCLISNGVHTFSDFNITSTGNMANIPVDITGMYKIYGDVSTDSKTGFTTASVVSRGVLNDKTVTDFSAEANLKINDDGVLKGGIIFRTASVGQGTNDMEGYSAILWKKTSSGSDYNRVVLIIYKYGIVDGNYKYLGTVGSMANSTVLGYYSDSVTSAAGEVLKLHINVVGMTAEAYFYGNTDPQDRSAVRRSQTVSIKLNGATDVEKNDSELLENAINYTSGGIGFYLDKTNEMAVKDLRVSVAETLTGGNDEPAVYPGGRAAVDSNRGSALQGTVAGVSQMMHNDITAQGVEDISLYSSNFDNYTYYSTGTTQLDNVDNTLISKSSGTKRAMLDGVTVKGFHAELKLKIDDEGTLKSGILFRVNDIKKGLSENGTLETNNIQGYSIVLYKTPGTENDYSRVVMCVYKYGIIKGQYTYLGTVGSKASSAPLTGYSEKINSAAGQELTLSVNLVGDELTSCFYNSNKPTFVSDTMTVDLKGTTDIENATPSMAGVKYDSGSIGLTVTNYADVQSFCVSEPIYPSTEVGDLSYLESYSVYSTGSGVTKTGDYFVAESAGTKKMIVNNVTISDFTASADITIDRNGNLKSGIIFRASEVGNAADAMVGYVLAVSRNFTTLGETNPNRIDIVLYKWGYQKGKLSYLGEVAREAYKSGASFMNGKMPGKEITLIVKVKGASLDATAYLKEAPSELPITFSSNLKFAGSNEKDDVAYYDSGSIGLFLGNSVSDPLNCNQVRNFNIDDGSGIRVVAGQGISEAVVGPRTSTGSIAPLTGEGKAIIIALAVFLTSVISITVFRIKSRYRKVL